MNPTFDPTQLRTEANEKALSLLGSLVLPPGTALAATGSLARGEMTPKSDLDLVLIHTPGDTPSDVDEVWYPIWDAKMRLDYSVRTPDECAGMISADSTAALALLDLTHIAGNEELTAEARRKVLDTWRREVKKNFNDVVDTAIARWRRSGSVVTMTRPDLKHGRGGLRDLDLINALALANLCNRAQLDEERRLLLDARTLLHVHAGRARDVLDPEFAVDVALDLGFEDRYELSRALAQASKKIDDALTESLNLARNMLPRRTGIRRTVRRPIDADVVDVDGEITLSRRPDLTDPGLVLRVAAAAARTGLPVTEATWQRLQTVPPLPERFTPVVASDFFTVLSSPENTSRVVEKLDEYGLWTGLVPEWEHIRGLMPREPIHVHTIDRHSLVVVGNCAAQGVSVPRPDLLYLAALYHDIGKGYDRPHEEVGAEFVRAAADRLGLSPQDARVVETLVAQHTRIPQIATTMDPTSDEALHAVLEALGYDYLAVDLMEALVEADSTGTGPGVFSPALRAGLRTLSTRARERLSRIVPAPPTVETRGALTLDVDQSRAMTSEAETTATLGWRGDYLRESVRVFALVAAKGWNIDSAELVVHEAASKASESTANVELSMRVYNTLGTGYDENELVQTYKSGVFSALPEIAGALTATFWDGDVLEVRTTDRRGALGTLIGALPPLRWLRMSNPGATMIVQCALEPGFDRAVVEREVTKALANR